ncbi:MAG: hypothetical protein ABFS45_17345 [Pseudomonadota bacterium]
MKPLQLKHQSNKIVDRHPQIGVIAKVTGAAAVALTLNGCLLTSPYWNQVFANHTAKVPIQAFTQNKSKQVKFECAKANHGGLYPPDAPAKWVLVEKVSPQGQALLDPRGQKVYGASTSTTLPAECWRHDGLTDQWYAAIRATQVSGEGDSVGSLVKFKTFNKIGLECLGRENGKNTSWGGWIGKGCTKTYSNSNSNIPYVIFRAEA